MEIEHLSAAETKGVVTTPTLDLHFPNQNSLNSLYKDDTMHASQREVEVAIDSISPLPSPSVNQLKKRTRRKKEQRRALYTSMNPWLDLFNKNVVHVYGDVCISSDLQIRLGGSVACGLSGIEYLKGTKVTVREATIEVEMEFSGIERISLDYAISQLASINSPLVNRFCQALIFFRRFVEQKQIEALASPMSMTREELEYEAFCNKCEEHINKETPTNSLYGYTIGRCNVFTGIVEVRRMSYSKEFLNLMCLNSEVLSQMYLRNKRINVFFDAQQMQEISLFHMESRVNEQFLIKTRVKMTTIDGYELWVNQTMDKMIDVSDEGRSQIFCMNLMKFDIDIDDLQGLIEYRTSLTNSKGLDYDRFIQVELSQILEDVEYSVQSQMFLEKYCKESLVQLAGYSEEMRRRRECGYRMIR